MLKFRRQEGLEGNQLKAKGNGAIKHEQDLAKLVLLLKAESSYLKSYRNWTIYQWAKNVQTKSLGDFESQWEIPKKGQIDCNINKKLTCQA